MEIWSYNKLLFIIIGTLEESWGRARLSIVSFKNNKALNMDRRKELCNNKVNATQFLGFLIISPILWGRILALLNCFIVGIAACRLCIKKQTH